MNRVLPWVVSFGLFFTTTIVHSGDVMTKQENDVLNAVQTMTKAFEAGDIEKVMSSYEAKASVVFEPHKPLSDDEIIRQTFTAWSGMNPTFEYSGHDVIINGDLAVHITPWSMKGKSPEGGDIEQSGLSVAVLRRQPNGDWKIVIDNPHGSALLNAQ